MGDQAHAAADKELSRLEKRLHAEYAKAARGMRAKMRDFGHEYEDQRKEWLRDVADGTRTKAEYRAWRQAMAARKDWYRGMVDTMATELTRCDQIAARHIARALPATYAEGFNFSTFQIERGTSVSASFSLYSTDTVNRLLADKPQLLPAPKVPVAKDLAYNRRRMESCLVQSVLQGESIPDAARRLDEAFGMGYRAALRTARTAITGAENGGRLDAYERAEALGLNIKKQWMAALDGRTRQSHRELDGEVRELKEPFSNGLMFPGDASGPAQEVYNCRCALVPVLDDDASDVPRRDKLNGMGYDEWKWGKDAPVKKEEAKLVASAAKKSAVAQALKAGLDAKNETFSGIWKDDVTLADWEDKHDKVTAKLQYFEKKLNETGDAKWAKLLDDTLVFDADGAEWAKAKADYDAALAEAKAAAKELEEFRKANGLVKVEDAFTPERKAAALRFTDEMEADRAYRPTAGRAWTAASGAEKDAAFGYTAGSGRFNRPLAGYKKPWTSIGSGWEERYYSGPNSFTIDYEGNGDGIRALTDLISHSTYDEDVWLRRGCGTGAIDKMLGVPAGTIDSMTEDQLQQFVGMSGRFENFISTGVAEGKGFGGDVDMSIYAPRGSQMLYAEPFSAFGTGGRSWDGKSTARVIGYEQEMIIQRGGSYTVTSIKRKGYGSIELEVEHHPEAGYDTFQQDPSEWTGPKESYK